MRKIPKYIWVDLDLDDVERRSVASVCFYLGKGVEETRRVLNGFMNDEKREIIEIAKLSGYTPGEHELCL